MEEKDIQYMRRAMELAYRGTGAVNPNPLVGAVVVKDGRIIAEGWHQCYGGPHAERNALKNKTEDVEGATMYVTLEPCCHTGKTPPCTDAVIEHRIAKVVVGLTDPNPLVAGKGIKKLRDAGIEVVAGVLEDELREQNRVFLKYITTRMPWVILKAAMTLDGKIAAHTGDSRWVTGEESRHYVQRMRAEFPSIMVGSGTVRTDDPLLNCRLEGDVRQPVRIVVDSRAAIALDSHIVRTAGEYRTVVVHTDQAPLRQLEALQAAGVETLLCAARDNRVDIREMLHTLGTSGIDAVLLEGGGELNDTFIRERLVDEVCIFVAPKIIGGREAKTPVEGIGFARMNEAVELYDTRITPIGSDFMIRGKIKG